MASKDDTIHGLHARVVELEKLLEEALGWMTEHDGSRYSCMQCYFVRRVNEAGVSLSDE